MKVLVWLFIGLDRHETSEHLLTAIIEKLCQKGHTVHILQKNTGGDLPLIPEKLKDYPVTSAAIDFIKPDKNNLAARYLSELKYIQACKKHISKYYDAVFIQSNTAAGFAVNTVRKQNKHAVITFNVQDIFPYNLSYCGKLKKTGALFRIFSAEQRYAYRNADHVITISDDMKQTLTEDGTPSDKIEVIYNWSYQDELYTDSQMDPAVAEQVFRKDRKNLLYAGNIGMMQGVDVIIETARLMTEEPVCFHIIGSGVGKEKLEQKAKEYGITNVSFHPPVPPEKVISLYRGADVNLIPLRKNIYRTALPSKTATILGCGKPVVFAIGKNSIFGRMIRENTECIVTDSEDPEALKESILEALSVDSHDRTDACYKAYFSITENSGKYADMIVKERK